VFPRQIPAGGLRETGREDPAVLQLDAEKELRAEAPVCYDLRLQRAGQEVVAAGHVRTTLRAACVRCGCWFDLELADRDFLCALPFASEDAELDLTPEMRESILLLLPSHPVCRADCKGLCPACGADRNRVACGCGEARMAAGWDALEKLKLELKQ
jgi:uncharacterized protein